MTAITRHIKPTPFHLRMAAHCRTNDWCSTGRFTTVDIYDDAQSEYWALRSNVAVADLTALYKYEVTGSEAVHFLDRLVTRSVIDLPIHRIIHTPFCNDNGWVIGDALVARLGETEFRLTTRAPVLKWLQDSAFGFEAAINDRSESLSCLAIRGPKSASVLEKAGVRDLDLLPPLTITTQKISGILVDVCRANMAGGPGYELFFSPDDALIMWDALFETGAKDSIRPVGQAVTDCARIENGCPLEGIDFAGGLHAQDLSRCVSPFDLGWSSFVDFQKTNFVGRRALERAAVSPPKQKLVGLVADTTEDVRRTPIFQDGAVVGATTSSVWSPTLCRSIAMAWMITSALESNKPTYINVDSSSEIRVDPKSIPVTISSRQFLDFST